MRPLKAFDPTAKPKPKTKQKLTTERISKLMCPPDKNRIYIPDGGTMGLSVCVTLAGTKTFIVYRRVNGRPTRVKLGQWPGELSLDDARKQAAITNGEIAKGEDPRKAKRAARGELTFGELFAHHIANEKEKNRTWQETERQYNRYLSAWSGRRLSEITRQDVGALHSKLGRKNGRTQANRVLATLRHMFAKTGLELGWDHPNPAAGIEKFEEQSRERFLDADELKRLFDSLESEPELFRDFFSVTLFTGARRGNVQAMIWEQVNLDAGIWQISATEFKAKRPMTVVLSPEVVTILRRRHAENADGSPWVFSTRSATGHLVEPKTAWKRILERAGIKDLRIHDLRRTLGSWQAALGSSLPIIGKSLGHSQAQTTTIYARLSLGPVRQSVESATAAMTLAAKPNKS